jgi:hypothetical protein
VHSIGSRGEFESESDDDESGVLERTDAGTAWTGVARERQRGSDKREGQSIAREKERRKFLV